MTLTTDSILALSPDAGSAANGKKLATPGKWPALSRTEGVIWGECQGSGSKPYLVGVDIRTPDYASKCSCPSRKFPCKHALALLLLSVSEAGNWQDTTPPEVLEKWLGGRQERAEKAAVPKAEQPEKAADPAAQAKRQNAREGKVTRGLEDLHLWLQDLVREGLLAARSRPYGEWDKQAARLIDAQAPGAARWVRDISGHLHDESGETLLAHLGKLALLCEGWTNRAGLSDPERADLNAALGQPLDMAALKAGDAQPTSWQVLGRREEPDGRLTVRRTWLGQDDKLALLLDFAPQNQALPPALPLMHTIQADVRFAPSAFPQRAVLAGEVGGMVPGTTYQGGTVAQLHTKYAQALALNPWLERVGQWLGPVRLCPDPMQVQDEHSHAVMLSLENETLWQWLAFVAGRPAYLFGEWDGQTFAPLSIFREDKV